jgi:hypothetical protein
MQRSPAFILGEELWASGDKRTPARQVEAHLMPEHRERAGAGPIVFLDAIGKNAF